MSQLNKLWVKNTLAQNQNLLFRPVRTNLTLTITTTLKHLELKISIPFTFASKTSK